MTTKTVAVTLIGGPTSVIEYAGLRFLTDPAFSPAGDFVSSTGVVLTKTESPALAPEELGHIDAVLLSHDQHADNLDPAGRALLGTFPLVLTTPDGAARLGDAAGLAPWDAHEIAAPDGAPVVVTALPATHGPDGVVREDGTVAGFLLATPNAPTLYVSGDNASVATVREIAERVGPVGVAVLFAGAARTGAFGGAELTLTSANAAEAARALGEPHVVPLHFRGWKHFTEGADDLALAFERAGLARLLHVPEPGQRLVVV